MNSNCKTIRSTHKESIIFILEKNVRCIAKNKMYVLYSVISVLSPRRKCYVCVRCDHTKIMLNLQCVRASEHACNFKTFSQYSSICLKLQCRIADEAEEGTFR